MPEFSWCNCRICIVFRLAQASVCIVAPPTPHNLLPSFPSVCSFPPPPLPTLHPHSHNLFVTFFFTLFSFACFLLSLPFLLISFSLLLFSFFYFHLSFLSPLPFLFTLHLFSLFFLSLLSFHFTFFFYILLRESLIPSFHLFILLFFFLCYIFLHLFHHRFSLLLSFSFFTSLHVISGSFFSFSSPPPHFLLDTNYRI